jgi:DNA excision repair protein ERCC-2
LVWPFSQQLARTPLSTVNLRQQTLDAATRNISTLKREIERVKQTDAGRLRSEYQRLVQVRPAGVRRCKGQFRAMLCCPRCSICWGFTAAEIVMVKPVKVFRSLRQGLQAQGVLDDDGGGRQGETSQWLANPALPDDILRESVPGNIRRAGAPVEATHQPG